MRQTVNQRKIRKAQEELEAELTRIVLVELQRVFRDLRSRLRSLDEQRPQVKLKKVAYFHSDIWGPISSKMSAKLLNALIQGAITITNLQNSYLMDAIGKSIEFDSAEFARQYKELLGQRITNTIETIRRSVSRRITRWYNTPGSTLKDITKELSPMFGASRAEMIARTEVTYLDTEVQKNIATALGIRKCWVNTMRDQSTCTRKLIGPDGQIYNGCRELQGKVFTVDQQGPPFHPNCRCNKILILKEKGE